MIDDSQLAIGLVQMQCALGDKEANLDKVDNMLSDLAGRAHIACLPEMFDVGYDLKALGNSVFELAEVIPGKTTTRLRSLAEKYRLAIVAGIVERDPDVIGLYYDTTVLVNRDGDLIGTYRKTHLYPAEASYFGSGNSLSIFNLDGLSVGVAICFEHAFPQIFTTLALQGARVVFNPSAVPVGFGYLQDLRTRARAQDNQIFVAAVNHVGQEGDVTYCGGSQIADPRGDVVSRAPDNNEATIVADISLDLIADQRRQEPIFRGFRPDLYLPGSK
jgi:predicted amidohydrolase